MARVTVEDCVEKVDNRFDLILLAAHRARQIASGAQLTIDRDRDKNPVVALREIGEGELQPIDLKEGLIHSLQKYVEVDEPEPEAAPLIGVQTTDSVDDTATQFDRMTEEDLLRGLDGIVPPAETRDEEE